VDWEGADTSRMKQEVSSKPSHEYLCLDLHKSYVTEFGFHRTLNSTLQTLTFCNRYE